MNENAKLNILHLEDDENDSELLRNELEIAGLNFSYYRVDNEKDFVSSLSDPDYNIVFSDFSLPTYNGLKALERSVAIRPELPFILVSGTLGEDAAVESMKKGATDYVLKNKLYKLIPTINRALVEANEKKLRQFAENRYGLLIESARDVIFTLSTNGTIVSLNKAFDEITGLKREDWIGRNFSGLIHPEDLPLAISKFENTIAGNKTERYEIRFINSEGVSLYGEILTALIWQDNIPGEILGIVRDVTERRNAEKLILNSLKEKEVLLKEIHHRVKNNLQVIISLLNMQSSELNDPEVMNSFREIQNRVVSMSLIHQSFYQSNSLSDIDFSVYIKRLAENLFKIFGFSREKTALQIDTSGIHISIDTAIPLGLLINEVLSNSLKHGFNENAEGKIYIELTENENEYILKLGDSGCGLPEEISPGKTNSLGMTLIKMLCDQIDGKIELNLNNGTEYIVKFPSKSYKDRLDGLSA